MRFLFDENLSHKICSELNRVGHDAVHGAEVGLASADDAVVLARARDERRVLVTCDHDFVQMLFASGDVSPSLMLTRDVDTMSSAQISDLLISAISPELEELLAEGGIATLRPGSIRVRPLPLRETSASSTTTPM